MDASWIPISVILGAVGLVTGVAALLTAVEVSKRVTTLVESKMRDAELRVAASIAQQDSELKKQRARLRELITDMESDLQSQDKSIADIRDQLAEVTSYLEMMVDKRQVAGRQPNRAS